jgi:hypothetical protein
MVKELPITRTATVLVDDEDFDMILNFMWRIENRGHKQYARNENDVYMHRLIMNAPKGKKVTHKNHNSLDNRKENLYVDTNNLEQRKISDTTIEITLKRGYNILIDTDDYQKISEHKWNLRTSKDGNIYAKTNINDERVYLHRFIVNAPSDKIVDHINHDTLDNRKANLRICTRQENNFNKLPYPGKYKGVFYNKKSKKYLAYIGYNNKRRHLGSFEKLEDAISRYNEEALKLFGEYALINDINKS